MSFLDRLFGKKGRAPKDEGIYFYIRCNHCGRVLHTRLDPQRELSTTESGYEIRKEMMDDRCFRPIFLNATFDRNKKVLEVNVEGGSQIDRESWEAEKTLPRRPATPEIDDER